MSCNWVTRKLDNLISIKHGFAFKGEFFTDKETYDYLVTPGNFAIGGGFKGDKFKYYNGPVPDNYILEVDALVVTMTDLSKQADTLGYSALVPKLEGHRTLHNQRVGLVESISNEIDKEFLYFLLRSKEYRHHIVSGATGTTVKHTSPTKILSYEFQLPPLDIQKKIAKNLIVLEKKVIINSNTNQTLEQIAQAIFKSWFVDFDPVKAKMNGEQPEGMDAATASLFPEKLVESELGLIPEGWGIHHTQDLFEVKDGTHDSPKKAEVGRYLVTSKHITKGKIDTSSSYFISDADFEKVNQRSKVDTFDILLTMIGTVGEVVVVYDNPVEFAIKNVGLFKTSQRPDLVWLFYWHLQSFKMKNYLEVRMAGTTQQYLTLKTLRTIPVVLPAEELLVKFNKIMSPLMAKISDNHKQNQTLSNLCDTLLPKLLSGEIELAADEVSQ